MSAQIGEFNTAETPSLRERCFMFG